MHLPGFSTPFYLFKRLHWICLTLTINVFGFAITLNAQVPRLILEGGIVKEIQVGSRAYPISRPLVSYQMGSRQRNSSELTPLIITTSVAASGALTITFSNASKDTIRLSNVVPFSPTEDDVFITGKGNNRLSRTHLFRPGYQPVNVIVPDNAWELGYCGFEQDGTGFYGLVRRDSKSLNDAKEKRFETIITSLGSVAYTLYVDTYQGPWQVGIRKCFQEKKLYDVSSFDESLYKRSDLKWIRSSYVMHLMMAWDKDYYDLATGKFNWPAFIERGKNLYGGDDVICLWPTWPTLGLDQRNQFDMYRDLPGGLKTLRILADTLRKHNTKFFIAYNPWDESTRDEKHLLGLAELIRETSADGVVLDTRGESSRELQEVADKVRPGVIMYSEGMAVPKDMQGIVSGRVHNALYYPPVLNLNKLIRPDFAIFRVAEVSREPIHREYAISFFNGYGTEINQFPAGHPGWEEDQYKFLGKTSRVLRENTANFNSDSYSILVPTLHDSLWVNKWPSGEKTLYTVFSLKPGGFKGPLIEVNPRSGFHWVDILHHRETAIINSKKGSFIEVETNAFNESFIGTNNEGQVTCVAELPVVLSAVLKGNQLIVTASKGNRVNVWAGEPAYDKTSVELTVDSQSINLNEKFGDYEGKIVIQVFNNSELIDEVVLFIKPGSARLISKVVKTAASAGASGMVRIPAGKFKFKTTHGDDFILYPTENVGESITVPAFYMDKFPVTNDEFNTFLKATGYVPTDTANFLKHWRKGIMPKGEERYPVVYISYEDALAYAKWANKRLPTEIEWQYASQTDKMNEWPWKQTNPVTRKEQYVTETLTVSSITGIDSKNCNLGDSKLYSVGKYPKGANPFGLQDLVGCVWQLTNDVYESGSYRYIMMKGGSYFKPSSSWWYVQGGPRELHYRQYLLRVSQGFERNGTVGFRCVRE